MHLFEFPATLPRPVRIAILITMQLVFFSVAYVGSFLIRFDFTIPDHLIENVLLTLPLAVGCKMVVFGAFRMHEGWWRYVTLADVVRLAKALAGGTLVFIGLNVFVAHVTIPRSVYILDFGIALLMFGAVRGSLRLLREAVKTRAAAKIDKTNLLILGAGDTGETLLREIFKNANLPFRPVGFLDDDPRKKGLRIGNVPVLGSIDLVGAMVERYDVRSLIIAMPSASGAEMRNVIHKCQATGATVQILPSVEAVLEGRVTLGALREVSISDLLGRDPVQLDMGSIGRFLQGRVVMVTGAGGSIGSEICRQVSRFNPSELVLIERGETPLFFVERELRDKLPGGVIVPYVASITDAPRMAQVFDRHKPDVIFHAAAYKHVPLMEANPNEAIKNNVVGTQVIADLAIEHEVDTFVLISTDKAVNPTSVMGASKRITELYVLSRQTDDVTTKFCAVRFGNVLGSNGSVVPIFREQIRKGGPVTVTHQEMTRYFMTIPEAAQLVLQAGAFGEGGEVFILDMGEPVRIADLAADMIRLSGLSLDDVPIVFTGVRPGEKLFEELSLDEEKVDNTRHQKIFVAHEGDTDLERFVQHYPALVQNGFEGRPDDVRRLLKTIIPEYKHRPLPTNVTRLDEAADAKNPVSRASAS